MPFGKTGNMVDNVAESNVADNNGVENNIDDTEHISLKVCGQDNYVIQFKMKKHIPLKKLMNAYCKRTGLDVETVRFRLYGSTICKSDTPLSLKIEEGDTIEVF